MSGPEKKDAEGGNAAPEKKPAPPDSLKPVTPKKGEGEGNLRAREAWFRKRSDSGEKAG